MGLGPGGAGASGGQANDGGAGPGGMGEGTGGAMGTGGYGTASGAGAAALANAAANAPSTKARWKSFFSSVVKGAEAFARNTVPGASAAIDFVSAVTNKSPEELSNSFVDKVADVLGPNATDEQVVDFAKSEFSATIDKAPESAFADFGGKESFQTGLKEAMPATADLAAQVTQDINNGVVDPMLESESMLKPNYRNKASREAAEKAQIARNDLLKGYGEGFETLSNAIDDTKGEIIAGTKAASDIISGVSDATRNITNNSINHAMNAMTGQGQRAAAGTNLYANNATGKVMQGGRNLGPGEQPTMTGDPTKDAIIQQYADQFGRMPSEEGLQYWTDAVANNPALINGIGEAINTASKDWTKLPNIPDGVGLEAALAELDNAPQSKAAKMSGVKDIAASQFSDAQAQGIARSGSQQATGKLEQYGQTGEQALQRQAAMTGALGPEAQQEFYDNFMESPGQKYFREKQEQALMRQSAAMGGLGGGNVRTALQEQAYGIAAQNGQQQFNNLGSISGMGLQARDSQGNIINQNAIARAGISANTAQRNAELAQAAATQNAANQLGVNSQNASMQQATNLENARLQSTNQLTQAGMRYDTGNNLANMIAQGGQSNLQQQTNAGNTLANLASTQGTNLATTTMTGGTNLANAQIAKGSNLANIATGQGYAQANIAQNQNQIDIAKDIGQNNNIVAGIEAVAGAAGTGFEAWKNWNTPAPPVTPTSYAPAGAFNPNTLAR